jgi:hypothetical protein
MNRHSRRARALLLGAACLSLFASADFALGQGTNPPTMTVQQFQSNPSALSRSANLTNDVAALLTADHGLLNSIIGLLANATPAQKRAIIDGLARVANDAKTLDPPFALAIQQAVAATRDQVLIGWFDAAAGQQGTASTGGGGGGGGSGGGGPTGSASGQGGGGSTGGGGNSQGAGNSFGNLLNGGSVTNGTLLSSSTSPH